jgi:23S rRNA pseudouridine2605 synthase
VAVRLQKYLAECGAGSRRRCEAFISAGRVAVNGAPATLGQSINPEIDAVTLDGDPVVRDSKVYVLLNKPKGVITTAQDTHDRRTVLHLIEGVRARVFPVGRLDLDVAGTLLLTNDGELSHRLTHPSYGVDKVYLAWVDGRATQAAVQRLTEGVELEDGCTAPCLASILKLARNATLIRLVIHEGLKRQVKRMCAAVGYPVRDLFRVAFGGISAEALQPGEWRYLSADEVAALRKLTHLDNGRGDED